MSSHPKDDSDPADLDVMELPFDQYQRYRLIGELCGSLRRDGDPLRVLDVGGRTGVLRRFLPDDRVELVDVAPSDVEGLVLGTGDRLPFRDDSFDVVVAADTLEHVPPDLRRAFVHECCRVAGRWAILAGPYQHPRVQEAEELLQGFLREKLGVEHQYLNEHRTLGLPERDQVDAWCREAGAGDVHAIGHGNLDRWLGLLTLELYLDDTPALRPLARRLFRFYSGVLYPSDREGVVYRHAVVASLDGTSPPTPDELFGAAELKPEAQGPIAHVLTELAAFDRERDVFQDQRDRLEGEIARRDTDLQEHEKSLQTAREDLEGHRASLAELEEDLAGHQASLLETEQDLKGHKGSLAKAREDRERSETRLVELAAYTEGLESELRSTHEAAQAVNQALAQVTADLRHATRWQRRFQKLLDKLLRRNSS